MGAAFITIKVVFVFKFKLLSSHILFYKNDDFQFYLCVCVSVFSLCVLVPMEGRGGHQICWN